jgi:hypothetical protein
MLTYFKHEGDLYQAQEILSLGATDVAVRKVKRLDDLWDKHQERVGRLNSNQIVVFGDSSVRGDGFFPRDEKKIKMWLKEFESSC